MAHGAVMQISQPSFNLMTYVRSTIHIRCNCLLLYLGTIMHRADMIDYDEAYDMFVWDCEQLQKTKGLFGPVYTWH